jgi:hypothetical protein
MAGIDEGRILPSTAYGFAERELGVVGVRLVSILNRLDGLRVVAVDSCQRPRA